MRRALLLLFAVVACNDAGLTTSNGPTPAPTSPGSGNPATEEDAGTVAPPPTADDWGDPKTTRVAGKLRVAQLNTRRFFDATCENTTCGDTELEGILTPEAFEKRATQLAAGIAMLQADVVTLAEVENQGCLDAVVAKLTTSGFTYPVAYVAETGGKGSIDVAVLARGKLDSVKNYKRDTPLKRPDGTNTSFTRELPEVHLTVGAKNVIVFAAHFRSKSNDDEGRRIAEAVATHTIMKATGDAKADVLVVLGGDLNDTPGSTAIDALEGDGALLRVAADLVPASLQGTYRFQGQDQAIDHIFTTKNHAGAYIGQSAKVYRDSGRSGFAGSDHAALAADFTLP